MVDGSQHRAEVPWRPPLALKQQLLRTPGMRLVPFTTSPAEARVDFEYAGHSFTAHDPLNDFWLFVSNAKCQESVLRRIVELLE
jgi:hypothetical protein